MRPPGSDLRERCAALLLLLLCVGGCLALLADVERLEAAGVRRAAQLEALASLRESRANWKPLARGAREDLDGLFPGLRVALRPGWAGPSLTLEPLVEARGR